MVAHVNGHIKGHGQSEAHVNKPRISELRNMKNTKLAENQSTAQMCSKRVIIYHR